MLNLIIVIVLLFQSSHAIRSRERTAANNTDVNYGNVELFSFGLPIYYGSGCPIDSVMAISSPGNEALTVLFSKFKSTTEGSSKNVQSSCNLAIPVKVKKGYSVTIYKTEYRGYTFVPKKSKTKFKAEYTFAGQKGPTFKKTFKKTQFFYMDPKIRVVSSMDCGSDVTLRINTSLIAIKKKKNGQNPSINIDSIDLTSEEENNVAGEFKYYMKAEKC